MLLQIMLTKNFDLAKGMSNGARGILEKFDEKTGEIHLFERQLFLLSPRDTPSTTQWVHRFCVL